MAARGQVGWRRTKVVDIELSEALPDLNGLADYVEVLALVRWHGYPLGTVRAPVVLSRCTGASLGELVLSGLRPALLERLVIEGLARPGLLTAPQLPGVRPSAPGGPLPSMTVAVCSRDRPDDLARCLRSLLVLDLPCEILVVDNAPTDDRVCALVAEHFPTVRYVREPRPGLNWARSRAALEATGDVVAYTDDDVVVDPGWARAIAEAFVDDPHVMGVSGLVLPAELDTEAQVLFERYGGFSRGFRRRWFRADSAFNVPRLGNLMATGHVGTGANMAYRRTVFAHVGLFDPALDVGTLTGGAGDHEMFFRVLKGGWTLAYEPGALVWHRHRRSADELRRQIRANSSVLSYFAAALRRAPEERRSVAATMVRWDLGFHARHLARSLSQPTGLPPDLVLAELADQVRTVVRRRYAWAVRASEQIAASHGEQPGALPAPPPAPARAPKPRTQAVREMDLAGPMGGVRDIAGYTAVRAVPLADGVPVGMVKVPSGGAPVSGRQLREALGHRLGVALVEPHLRTERARQDRQERVAAVLADLVRVAAPAMFGAPLVLPDAVDVSVVISTFDRPDDLRRCLTSVRGLRTARKIEILVVDNHPTSGVTAQVIPDFPEVTFLAEPRQGVAFGRNHGIVRARGDIVATLDDDAVVDPDWLETLVRHFARADVAAVSGNVLPVELETVSQQRFEDHSGLGRGYVRWDADPAWFAASATWGVPTWVLGGTCNAAFRRSIFTDPEVGLLDESLGPGMPSGVGEDSYAFYRVLRRGHTMVYEPEAVVRHGHRRTDAALRRQLLGYYRGGVAHQLATLHHDGDLRALPTLLWALPSWHLRELARVVTGRSTLPLDLWALRVWGSLGGPRGYLASQRVAARLGRTASPSALPVADDLPGAAAHERTAAGS